MTFGEVLLSSDVMSKSDCRAHLKVKISNFLNQNNKALVDQQVCSYLSSFLHQIYLQKPVVGASFLPMVSEPAVNSLDGFQFAYPKIESDSKMNFLAFDAKLGWQINEWGIKEPVGQDFLKPNELPFVLVPALGFSQDGHRLGHGKGYYDFALKDYSHLKIGVCYSVQVMNDTWLSESHDVSMDYIITEKFILEVNR